MLQSVTVPGVAALAGLPVEMLSDLMSTMHLKAFKKGQNLFVQGEEPHAIYFVESGRVKWHKVSEDGIEQILQVSERGEAVGLVSFLDRCPHIATATAVEDTVAWMFTIGDFEAMIVRQPRIAIPMMRMLGDAVRGLLEHVHCMTTRSAHDRVSSVLLRRAENAADQRVIRLTHQEIAHLGGMARETVSRVLADFQRRGAVRLTRNAIVLLDAHRLWSAEPEAKLG